MDLPHERYEGIYEIARELGSLAERAHVLGFDDIAGDLQDMQIGLNNGIAARMRDVEQSN